MLVHQPLFVATWLLSTAVPLASAQGPCDHYLDDLCVDAYGSKSFDFEPLFEKSPSFGYGFRVEFYDEWNIIAWDDKPPGYEGDAVWVKLWLSYEDGSINLDPKANRTTDLAMLFTNATGTVGGGNNGCDGLLGTECADNLKDVLKWSVVNNPLGYPDEAFSTIARFQLNPPVNLTCPDGIWEDYLRPTEDLPFVAEHELDDDNRRTVRTVPAKSGNTTDGFYTRGFYRSAEDQLTRAVIGVAARFPSGPGTVARNYDDIQLELVCFRPEPVEGSEDRIDPDGAPRGNPGGGGAGGSGDNAAAGLDALPPLFGVMALVATLFLW